MRFKKLQALCVAIAPACLPFRADLFCLYVPGNSKKGDSAGIMLGHYTFIEMPSILCGRI
jgi:hypothetical protein